MSESRVTVWCIRFADRPNYVLQWIDPDTGQRRSKSAGTPDEKQARQEAADLEFKLNNGMHAEAAKMDWDKFRLMFEDEYLAGLRERTREKYQTVLDVFEQIINPAKLKNVNERTLSQFVKGMRERKLGGGRVGLAPWTQRNYLVSLKTAMQWAESQKLIPKVPKFPTVKVPKKKPQPIPDELFHRLLAKAPDQLWKAYLLCGWWAGLRLSEVLNLLWERSESFPWLDFEGNRIVIPATFAKSNVDQSVALAPVLRQALAELPRTEGTVFPLRSKRTGKLLSRTGITNRILFFAKKAGVKLSMHKLRKGFGCRVAKQLGKGNAPILHTLMRHSSMQVTMDFYASVDDAVQDAMSQLT